MSNMTKVIGYVELLIIILLLFNYLENKINLSPIKRKNIYHKRRFMTDSELNFYIKIKSLETQGYRIVPQTNLATIIEKDNKGFNNELFRNIDFAIFDEDFKNLLLLIELNDVSHKKSSRIKRDIKVKSICNSAGVKLITFYTRYPNNKEYVIKRIKQELCISNNNDDGLNS